MLGAQVFQPPPCCKIPYRPKSFQGLQLRSSEDAEDPTFFIGVHDKNTHSQDILSSSQRTTVNPGGSAGDARQRRVYIETDRPTEDVHGMTAS